MKIKNANVKIQNVVKKKVVNVVKKVVVAKKKFIKRKLLCNLI